ncbi:MAG TPA: tRNA (5-methylaminomethyl-2-thiouridine)(34)-methyltransferase MnmD, partial [Dongiaceae bacterium]|nr:tRNA (5-methylaminomethyl-2-thiouridine)(34)-methyltransferase MnmD [Dongiaceae bacterium]
MSQDSQQTPPNSPLQPASLEWQQDVPVSRQFGDVYFSRDDGAAETRHVFIGHNDLPQRWQAWHTPGSFVIGETGFGTGLNFLCAWELWRQLRKPGQHLHVVSVEKFPLSKADLERAGTTQQAFAEMAAQLQAQYPPLVRGSHRLHFHGEQLTLTLIFGDAIDAFAALDGKVDAWFLDGFAPARNPDMWQPALFAQLARLSHTHTTFATFTAAGDVRRGLAAVGFSVEKCAGFGRKRDMLKGVFADSSAHDTYPPAQAPWFRFDYQRRAPGQVAIVGAGLAGCAAAHVLAQRGWQVTVFEAENDIASQASGNPTGITYTRLSVHDSPQNRYYQFAYLHACRYLRDFFAAQNLQPGADWNLNGVLQLAWDESERAEQQKLLEPGLWPDDVVAALTPEQVSALTQVPCPHPALLMKLGGWLNPAFLCRTLLQHPGIQLRTSVRAE